MFGAAGGDEFRVSGSSCQVSCVARGLPNLPMTLRSKQQLFNERRTNVYEKDRSGKLADKAAMSMKRQIVSFILQECIEKE